jgi:cation/acetate symporter
LVLVILGPAVYVDILGNAAPVVPYKFPAIFSVPLAFIAIWFFSVTDGSEDAKRCEAEFDAQDIRCQTGIGSDGAVAH